MKIRSIVLGSILACSFQWAHGAVKEESIDADKVGKAVNPSGKSAEYKLELKDSTLTQIIEAFNKQTNTNLKLENPNGQRKPEMIYDLNFTANSLEDALDQLARQLHMGIYNGGDNLRISPSYQEGLQGFNRRQTNSGYKPDSAMISGISVNENIGDNQQKSKNMSVNISCYAGERGFVGVPKVKVIEAVDEQGRDISVQGPGPNFGTNRIRGFQQMGVSAQLSYLDPPAKKLAKFKAEVTIDLPKTYKRVIITELGDQPVECTISGVKAQVGPVVKEGDQWIVKIRQPQNNNVRIFEDLYSVRVFAETGSGMYLQSNGWGGGNGYMEANTRVSLFEQNFGRSTGDLPKPVSLVWDTVDQVETKTITVEAADIAIP